MMKALVGTGSLRWGAAFRPPAAIILTYHSVRNRVEDGAEWIGPGITHAADVFSRQMELIASRFHPVTLEEIGAFVRDGSALPRRAVAITFDDGFLDNVECAAPILQRFGISAAFYLMVSQIGGDDAPWYSRIRYAFTRTKRTTWRHAGQDRTWELRDESGRVAAMENAFELCAPLTGNAQCEVLRGIEAELDVERTRPPQRIMMTWEEAQSLRKAGHIVGSHTLTHPNVAHVGEDGEMRREVTESKRCMEERMREPVMHFSYPHPALNPQWNERTLRATREAGYATAVTMTKGPNRVGQNPLLLKRINCPRPEHEFLWNLERAFLKA
jgi:peptidoglycan/xylan/chitin deacetylase (PgdA/CDA1 family)